MAQVRMFLRDAEDGNIPAVCVCCGEAATTTRTKSMQWFPPWVHILILAGLLPYAIVASILTKRAKVKMPFCDQHKGHWFHRSLLMWGTFFLGLILGGGGLILGINLERHNQDTFMPFICIGATMLFVLWLITLTAAHYTSIRPSEITDDEVELTGVADSFSNAILDDIEDRRSRRRERHQGSWRDEEDQDAPPRRPRRGPDDAFER